MNMMKKIDLIKHVIERRIKFIIVTGGVCSSIGKGVLVSSLGVLVKSMGYSLSVVKWDPYLNVDPGTMSPLEHGEVFVTADGAETDLDLGHYERMIGVHLTKQSSVSSGQIFQEILQKERTGEFLGKCIQLVPHVVDAIKQRLLVFALDQEVDAILVEIGGTVGDMEGKIFLEAIRQIRMELGSSNFFHSHLSYVPVLEWTGEIKTKPTQHSVNSLKEAGLVPDSLFLRSDRPISQPALQKLAVMCGVSQGFIFQVLTHNPIYKLFVDLDEQKVGQRLQEYFYGIANRNVDLSAWCELLSRIEQAKDELCIAMVAKYVGRNDPYISVIEALKAAAYWQGVVLSIKVIDAEALEGPADNESTGVAWDDLKAACGIIIPGGFDKRGSEGKMRAVQWARENNVPYLGLCLGMQVMLIEIARHVLKLEGANSSEFDQKTLHPVISLLCEQQKVIHKGASMRLGEQLCQLREGTKVRDLYGAPEIKERHRHRYEFNNLYKKEFEEHSVIFSGVFEEKDLVEIAEMSNHPFMIGVQFHPEFSSTPLSPHPLFLGFINAALAYEKKLVERGKMLISG